MPMEEFDSALSKISNLSQEETRENLWVCGASKASLATDGSEWCKEAMQDTYVPAPYLIRKVGTNGMDAFSNSYQHMHT